MGGLHLCQIGYFLGFCLIILLALSLCYGSRASVDVEVSIESENCIQDGVQSSETSPGTGLLVNIDCRSTGRNSRLGAGEVDDIGNFRIKFLQDKNLEDQLEIGRSTEDQLELDAASGAPFPGQEAQNLLVMILKSIDNVKQASAMIRKLKFSSIICTSIILRPLDKNKKQLIDIPPSTGKSFEYPRQPSVKAFLSPKSGLMETFPASAKKKRMPFLSSSMSRKLLTLPGPTAISPGQLPTPAPILKKPVLVPPSKKPSPLSRPNLENPLPPEPPLMPHFYNPLFPMAEAPKNSLPPFAPYIKKPPSQLAPTYQNAPPPDSRRPMIKTPHFPPLAPTYKNLIPVPAPAPHFKKPLPPVAPVPKVSPPMHQPVPTFKKSAPPPQPPVPVPQPNAPLHPPISPTPMPHPSTKMAHESAPSPLPIINQTPPTKQDPSPPASQQKSFYPIPRAPPIPQLPPVPKVPRRYFNPPKYVSQPPTPPS